MSLENITYSWSTSVEELDPEQWNSCFEEGDVLNSYEMMQALLSASFENIEFHILFVKKNDITLAIIPCYVQRTLIDIAAPQVVHSLCNKIRKLHHSFFTSKVLFVGIPIAICKGSLGISKVREDSSGLLLKLSEQLEIKGKSLGAKSIVLKEIEDNDLEYIKSNLPPSWRYVSSHPTSIINIDPKTSYKKRLRNRYRAVYKQRRGLFEKNELIWEKVSVSSSNIDEIYRLFKEVEENQRPLLPRPKDFFHNLVALSEEDLFIIVAKKNGACLAFGLLVIENKSLFLIYIGFDYKHRDSYALYYNTLYRAIDEAERLQCSELRLGQTSYKSKALIGASFRPLHLGVLPLSNGHRFMVSNFEEILFPQTELPNFRALKELVK